MLSMATCGILWEQSINVLTNPWRSDLQERAYECHDVMLDKAWVIKRCKAKLFSCYGLLGTCWDWSGNCNYIKQKKKEFETFEINDDKY